MFSTTLSKRIYSLFSFAPTAQQEEAIALLSEWCFLPVDHKVFMLKGFAGTGKTSIVSALIGALRSMRFNTIQLAPTGRAAKVLSNYSGQSAFSIHKMIYRQKSIASSEFSINYNNHRNTIFIVDEASMISNKPSENSQFGSGKVLDDLIEYVYSGDNCSMILLGDTAQLLPIGQNSSPALEGSYLEGYGLEVTEYLLTQVVRQAEESGILYNATLLRQSIETEPFEPIKFDTHFKDIFRVSGEDLIDQINSSYGKVGEENSIILTYSNKRAVLYNRGVRNQVLYREDELSGGDYLIITKNNYFWSKPYENLDFIANGNIAEVVRVGKRYEAYGCNFADVTLRLIDYEIEITARILIDSLYAETPSDQYQLMQRLTENIAADYQDIGDKRKFWQAMRSNEYYNSLQVKFSYAITCHKAQGGTWSHVFIDQGFITEEMLTAEYYQWLYTAMTRAQERVYLVNFSDYFFE